jgi:hypothetical protein
MSWGKITYVALALATLSCTDNQDEPGARELWARLQGARYESWPRPPNYEGGPKPSFTAHADKVEIYLNPEIAKALAERKPLPNNEWPRGSLVVKRGYTTGGKLVLVAAMDKRQDGWFFYEYDSDGKPIFSGRPKLCVDCHEKGADKIWSFGFPR